MVIKGTNVYQMVNKVQKSSADYNYVIDKYHYQQSYYNM